MRKLVALCAALTVVCAPLGGGTVAVADQWTKINKKQCDEAHAAVEAGLPLPDPSLFAQDGTSLNGNVLELYVTTRFKDDLKVAIENWEKVLDGKVEIRLVDQPTKHSVTVKDATYDIGVAGYNRFQPREIVLNNRLTPGKNVQYILAHEMGHAMGLGHTCDGDIMLHGGSGKTPSLVPTKTDGAAVIQNLR